MNKTKRLRRNKRKNIKREKRKKKQVRLSFQNDTMFSDRF